MEWIAVHSPKSNELMPSQEHKSYILNYIPEQPLIHHLILPPAAAQGRLIFAHRRLHCRAALCIYLGEHRQWSIQGLYLNMVFRKQTPNRSIRMQCTHGALTQSHARSYPLWPDLSRAKISPNPSICYQGLFSMTSPANHRLTRPESQQKETWRRTQPQNSFRQGLC